MNELAKRIRELRKAQIMTTAQLAGKVNKLQSTISDIETGKTALKADELSKFAEALGVSVYFLLTGIEDKNSAIARETGLSNKTINKIKTLDEKKKALLELLINDEGRILSEKDYASNPDLEPEKGFMDALADYTCDPTGNKLVEIKCSGSGTEDDPLVEKVVLAPQRYKIQLTDGSLHEVSEWMPNGKPVANRLKVIRARYLNNLKPIQYIPSEEEGDDE